MDQNLNAAPLTIVPKGYFEKKVPENEMMTPLNRVFFLEDLAVIEKGKGADIIEIGERVHITEDNWSYYCEKGDATKAIDFWTWVLEMLEKGGKKVEEMTLELADCADDIIYDACRPLKLKLLENLPKMCPQLAALKIKRSGIYVGTWEARRDLVDKLDPKSICESIQCMEIDHDVTQSHIGNYLHHKFLCGNVLSTLTISWEQLAFVKQGQVFHGVVNLGLGHFGAKYNNDPKFLQTMITLFPALQNLKMFNSFCDIVHELPAFVNGLCSKLNLDSLRLDQSFSRFLSKTDEKIDDVKTIELSVKCYGHPLIVFLKIVTNYQRLIISEWDDDKEPGLRREIVRYVKKNVPTCKQIQMKECDGTEHIIIIN